jgi:hypothetical protein
MVNRRAADREAPPVKRSRYAERNEWINAIRDAVIPTSVKVTALVIASYGDLDGSRIFPSQRRLMATTQQGESTVRNALKFMRDNGLLYRESRGSNMGRNGIADSYRLTLPEDLETRFRFVPAKGAFADEEYRIIHQRDNSGGWNDAYEHR